MTREVYFPNIVFDIPPFEPFVTPKRSITVFGREIPGPWGRILDCVSESRPTQIFQRPRISDEPMWSISDIFHAQDEMLKVLALDYGVEIPLDRIQIDLLRREELSPANRDNRRRLGEMYGEDIVKYGSIGDYLRLSNGIRRVRLGYFGDQYSVPFSEVKRTLVHEVGHALASEPIPDKRFAELCAYAWQFSYGVGPERQKVVNPQSIHSISRAMLWQLIDMGIKPAAIIAHLTGSRFGDFGPEDYREQNNSRVPKINSQDLVLGLH